MFLICPPLHLVERLLPPPMTAPLSHTNVLGAQEGQYVLCVSKHETSHSFSFVSVKPNPPNVIQRCAPCAWQAEHGAQLAQSA